MREFWVYILASRRNGTLYVGVTNDLIRRIHEHRTHTVPGFTSRHGVTLLVHFESWAEPRAAIQREKALKHWPRRWKIALIERRNPDWRDLWGEITGGGGGLDARVEPGHDDGER
jgi:putative endonuclease